MEKVYDLHITVDPRTFDPACLGNRWRMLDIQNVQGMPHFIASKKHIGLNPENELERMASRFERNGVRVLRRKIELTFIAFADARKAGVPDGIVEVHYKYSRRGAFSVSEAERAELDRKKIALSFNASSGRVIVSARFANLAVYEKCGTKAALPPFLEDEEREVVVKDDNNALDSFWPLRTLKDGKLEFSDFSRWIPHDLKVA